MGLLLADLRGFTNGARHDGGRGVLLPRLLPPLLLGGMYWLLGRLLLEEPQLLRLLHQHGDSLQLLFGTALSPCPLVAGWVGLAHAQRQLFEGPELQLWLAAPLWPGRPAVQVLLRAAGTALLWSLLLCLPFLLELIRASGGRAAAAAVAVVAVAATVLSILCAAMALQIVLLRLSRGAVSRFLLGASSALAAFGFPVFLLLQVFTGAPARAAALAEAAREGGAAPPLVADAAAAMAAAARGSPLLPYLGPLLLPMLGGLALFLCCARLHPVAVEHHRLAFRPRRWSGRGWPRAPAASLRRKELVQLRQQRGALLHMLLVLAMVLVLARQRLLGSSLDELSFVAIEVRQTVQMLLWWFLAALMQLYAHMGRLIAADGAQWPLYRAAPVQPGTLLRGKLQAIALLMVWPIAVAAITGRHVHDASWPAILAFSAVAASGTLVALGVVAAVGTLPPLLRREADGTLQQGARGLAASIVLVVAFELAIAPAFVWWQSFLRSQQHRREIATLDAVLSQALPLCLAFGVLLLALGILLARRNVRRLLAAC